jgi:hypothetical protein
MVGVGGECISRDLPGGRKLRLSYQWESDESLADGVKLDGELPGPGVMDYIITLVGAEDADHEEPLQGFSFKGGGDINTEKAPLKVVEAFENWYRKLTGAGSPPQDLPSPSVEVNIEYVGSVITEGDVDRVIAAVAKHAKAHLMEYSELSPERAQKVRKKHEILELLRNPTTGETEKDIQRRLREPEVGGAHRDSRMKGISVRAHNAEEMDIAFMDYGTCWILSGSVKVQFDAIEDVLNTLEFLKREGVQLEAKQVWYYNHPERKRFEWKMGEEVVYHADAAARGENPYYPGLPAVPPGGYRWPNPTGVWKTEARDWLSSHPHTTDGYFTSEDVEALYAHGATRVDVTFHVGSLGLEVVPPADTDNRRELAGLVYSMEKRLNDDWDEELGSGLKEERIGKISDARPWTIL